MKHYSWPLAFALVAVLAGCQSGRGRLPPRELPPGEQCDRDLLDFNRSLGTLRQYPDVLTRYMLSHKPGDKLDYAMCYNTREQLKRDIAVEEWKRSASPLCQKHFVADRARFDAKYPPRYKREPLSQQIARYNESCSHTSTGQL